MNSSKDAALAQVAEAAQQQDTSMLIANTNDRDERGLLRANSRKAANTAAAQADAAARRAGATSEEIRQSRES
jgi:hypothetical protein